MRIGKRSPTERRPIENPKGLEPVFLFANYLSGRKG